MCLGQADEQPHGIASLRRLVLDGPQQMHDAWRVDPRGKGTFDKVLNAARLLQRHQVEFNILTEIFDEWVARDVGSMFVINFDFSLANWLGTPTACIFAPECGDTLALERNGDRCSCDHYVNPENLLGNILTSPMRQRSPQRPRRPAP